MTNEELDLARARDMAAKRYSDWEGIQKEVQDWCLNCARAVREGDAVRGLVVVPRGPIDKVRAAMAVATGKSATSPEYFAVSFALSEMTVAMLAASPLASEP